MLVAVAVSSSKKRRLRSSLRHHEAKSTLEAQAKPPFLFLAAYFVVNICSDRSDEWLEGSTEGACVQYQLS